MSRYDKPSHTVYMTFFSRHGWQVQFLEPDAKTPLPRAFTFKDPEKIRELARRGEAWGTSEDRQMLEYGIEVGRGGCYLRLTPGQYRALRDPRRVQQRLTDPEQQRTICTQCTEGVGSTGQYGSNSMRTCLTCSQDSADARPSSR